MIKGVYKEFISVKITDNPIYDEALFVLKCPTRAGKKSSKPSDLIFEANRILCEQGVKKPKKRFKVLKRILFSTLLLLLGGFSGALITFFVLKLH